MTYAIWAAIVRCLQRVFAPQGNLLTADIVAEVTVHLLSSGQRKTWGSKIDSVPMAQQMIEALLGSAIDLGKQYQVQINWDALKGVDQFRPPTGGPK